MRKQLVNKTLSICLLGVALVFAAAFTSCEKEEDEVSFSDFTLADIKALESEMGTSDFVISDASGIKWNAGDIWFYVTSEGRYGKFEVISVNLAENYKLTLNAVTYDASGAVYKEAGTLIVRGTWRCDLDEMVEGVQDDLDDFKNNRATETDTFLTPFNSAAFVKYTK